MFSFSNSRSLNALMLVTKFKWLFVWPLIQVAGCVVEVRRSFLHSDPETNTSMA